MDKPDEPHCHDFLVLDLGAGISPTVLSFAAMLRNGSVIITPEPTSLTDSYALIKVLTPSIDQEFPCRGQHGRILQGGQSGFRPSGPGLRTFPEPAHPSAGHQHKDPMLMESVRHQVPLLKFAPDCRAAKDIREIAHKIADRRVRLKDLIARSPILKSLP